MKVYRCECGHTTELNRQQTRAYKKKPIMYACDKCKKRGSFKEYNMEHVGTTLSPMGMLFKISEELGTEQIPDGNGGSNAVNNQQG